MWVSEGGVLCVSKGNHSHRCVANSVYHIDRYGIFYLLQVKVFAATWVTLQNRFCNSPSRVMRSLWYLSQDG